MLFERILPESMSPLKLTVACRHTDSLSGKQTYLSLLEETLKKLKHHPQLLSQPLFKWGEHDSPCWRFEKARILQEIVDEAVELGKRKAKEGDYVEAKKKFDVAVAASTKALENTVDWVLKPRILELNQNFLTSQVLNCTALKYRSIYLFKPLKIALTKSFQAAELSSRLWHNDSALHEELQGLYHHFQSTQGDDFQEQYNHIHRARELHPTASIVSDFEEFDTRNAVHHCLAEHVSGIPCANVKAQKAEAEAEAKGKA